MNNQDLDRLNDIIANFPLLAQQIDAITFANKPNPDKWSKKEIVGHLIDSASNNLHRFVRAQYEDLPRILYNQEEWVKANAYQAMGKEEIIALWTMYNQHFYWVVRHLDADKLAKKCLTADHQEVDLNFLFSDYVAHLEHHIDQLKK